MAMDAAEPRVEIVECPAVDRGRLESQVALELRREGADAEATAQAVLRLRCDEGKAVAEIEDADGVVLAQRELPALSPDGGDERTLALVFGELWAFHRPAIEPASEPQPEAKSQPEPQPEAKPQSDDEPAPRPRVPMLWVTASAGAAARALLDTPVAAATIAAGVVGRLSPRVSIGALLQGDVGRLQSDLGLVRLWSIGVTAAPRVRVLARPRWGMDLALPLTAGYGRLQGIARADDARAASTASFFADVGASIGPWAAVGVHEIGFTFTGGYRLRQPEGLVGTTTRASLGGPWVGGALELRLAAVTRVQSR